MSNVPEEAPTVREIYQLVGSLRDHMDQMFSRHELEHVREQDKRRALVLWAVTTVLTMVGLLVAIYVAARPG